ncbi:MAG: carbohydrate binding family 9 domain-containing protein [Bacteroidetes bacterium]|nr:carbohydrate binding family 9 domain-containing protein [Bacteroidota bacterium]MCW5895723.1 carbohydrate binding family 9 domain-containing protein [Bacteroidota bacterium]
MRSVFCAIACLALLTLATASENVPANIQKTVHAVRIADAITIDGVLSDPVWQQLQPAVTSLYQREPEEGKPATERTEIYIVYDDAALYVAARLYDTAPDSIVARLTRRDVFVNADDFGIYLDPYYDRRSGVYFGLNAAGTLYDGVLYNDDWDDNTWDGVWEGKAAITTDGWSLEMRIPFSQLRFRAGERQVWGVNFLREISRKNEKAYLVYTPKNGSGFVSRFADLVGMDNLEPPRRLEILPYVSTKAEYTRRAHNDPFNNGSRYTPGFGADIKFGIGSNLTVDATVNPDFGQVEVDPAVVNLSDVETFFNEKRPFFIEGSTIFEFGYGGSNNNWGFNWGNPGFFYSRRVGRTPQGGTPDNINFSDVPSGTHILGAAKLTGKLGDSWNVGSINALTKRELADIDSAGHRFSHEVEPLTYYGIFRGQKEFDGGRQGLGFLSSVATRSFSDNRLRDQLNSSSLTFGIDGWTFLDADKVWVITGWTGLSHVRGNQSRMIALQRSASHYFQRPDASHVSVDSSATSLQGYAGRIALNKQKGNFYVNAAFGFIDPKFNTNDLGFMWRNDILNGHLVLGYKWTEPTSVYRRITMNFSHFRSYDFEGNQTWGGFWNGNYIQFPNYYSIQTWFAYNPETYSNRRTRGGPLTINPPGYEFGSYISTDDRKDWVFSVEGNINNYQQESNRGRSVYLGIEYKPAPNVSVRLNPSMRMFRTAAQWVTSREDAEAAHTFGRRYIFGELNQREVAASIRLNWTFTPELSLQMYIQPLISVGEYRNMKELARPKSYEFNTYGVGSSTISRQDDEYVIDPDGAGPAQSFTVSNPDFNFKSLRGSAVLRWEYMPGSTIYFVWTQQRTDDSDPGTFRFGRDVRHLFRSQPDNILLIKLSFWTNP